MFSLIKQKDRETLHNHHRHHQMMLILGDSQVVRIKLRDSILACNLLTSLVLEVDNNMSKTKKTFKKMNKSKKIKLIVKDNEYKIKIRMNSYKFHCNNML